MGGHGNDRDVAAGQLFFRPKHCSSFEAIHHRHLNIHEHNVEQVVLTRLDRFRAITRGNHRVAALLQQADRQSSVYRVIFRQQDSRTMLVFAQRMAGNQRYGLRRGHFIENLADPIQQFRLANGLHQIRGNAQFSRRSSFHTTICVLEGLLDYERAGRKSAAVTKARKRAENYLLERRMFRSLRTGKVIDKRWLRFSFPTFWHYDVLRGLEYLRNAGIKPDRRVREAIKVVIERRHQNGRWPLNLLHPELIPLQMETNVGSASRWSTLRALRVLRWYNNSTR